MLVPSGFFSVTTCRNGNASPVGTVHANVPAFNGTPAFPAAENDFAASRFKWAS